VPEDVAGAPFMAVGSSAPEFFTVIRPARDRVGRGRRRHRRRAAVFNSMTIVGLTGIFAGHLDQQRLA
jgi:Ca2+/Na+ antiporter